MKSKVKMAVNSAYRVHSVNDISVRTDRVLNNRSYVRNFKAAKSKWLDVNEDTVIAGVLDYLSKL